MAELPGASIAVITKNESGEHCVVTIQRDSNTRTYADLWELPGGTLELGETPEIAAIRECHEEVNIQVDACEVHGNDRHLVEGIVNTTLVVAMVAFEKASFQMRLGEEGTACDIVKIGDFLTDPCVIPEHRMRLRRYLLSIGHSAVQDSSVSALSQIASP